MCPDFIGVAHGGRQPGHHLRNQGIGPDVIFFGHAEDVVNAGLLLDAFCQVGLHRFASHDVVAKGQAGSGHFGHEPVAAARQLLHLAHGLRVGFTIGQRAHRARQCAQALADGAADQEPAQHQHAANERPHQGEHAGALIGERKLLLLRGFGVPKDGGDHIGSMFRDAGVVPGGFVHEPQALFGPGVGLLQGMDQALGVGLEILACGGGVVSPLVVMLHLAQFLEQGIDAFEALEQLRALGAWCVLGAWHSRTVDQARKRPLVDVAQLQRELVGLIDALDVVALFGVDVCKLLVHALQDVQRKSGCNDHNQRHWQKVNPQVPLGFLFEQLHGFSGGFMAFPCPRAGAGGVQRPQAVVPVRPCVSWATASS